jgi:serine protease
MSLSSAIRTYYSPAYGLSGASLKAALNSVIRSGHTRISYSGIWNVMDDADAWNGKVVLMYTGAEYNPGIRYPTWNREHTWPKSHGFPSESQYAHTDAHHLRPTDPGVNSTRGNKDFDNGGSLVSGTADCYTDSDSFEPRDAVKGDVARIIFYMAVRYEGDDGDTPDLRIVNTTGTSGAVLGKLSTLLQWHLDDPVDDRERQRNQRIYDNWQHNRNPFIDYPDAVRLIWGTAAAPVTY